MTLNMLADEYFNQVIELNKLINELRELEETSTGQTLHTIQQKIRNYKNMAFDCKKTAEYLSCYYQEKDEDNENRFYRQKFVGVHYAMPYTLKCFSLRIGTTDRVAD